MKVTTLYFLILCGTFLHCFSQSKRTRDIYRPDTLCTLIEIKNQPTQVITGPNIVNTWDEEDSFLLSTTSKKHNNYHVMVLRLKPGVKLITLQQLFDLYHIEKKYRGLDVHSNKNSWKFPTSTLVSPTAIKDVKVIKSDDDNSLYINITTVEQPPPGSVL